MRSIYLFLIFFIYHSCNSKTPLLISSADEEVISKMIDEVAYPVPPPPALKSNDTTLSKTMIDSLLKLKLKVAIFPILESDIETSVLKDIPQDYISLLNFNNSPSVYIGNLRGVSSKKGHEVVLADTLKLKKSAEFKNFDLLLNFSQIRYNENFTKAIFELGVSRSRLAGSAAIYCLKKENNSWTIDHVIQTTIW